MMIIDLTRPWRSPLEFDLKVAAGEIDLESEGVSFASDVSVKGTATRHIVQTDIAGTITSEINIDCTRCLEPVREKLEIPFTASYISPENYTEEKEVELKDDDLDIAVSEDNQIDLKELAREQILLNLPEQVLCKEDCKGLCAKCGASRNLINCNCDERETDPRWAALGNLIK